MTDRRAEIAERLTFLEQVASYFEHRDTRGEDQAHWANVYNAKNCREIAAELTRLTAEAEAQRAEITTLKAENLTLCNVDVTLTADLERMRAALSDARDALRNDFEPDNQSRAWHRANNAIAAFEAALKGSARG